MILSLFILFLQTVQQKYWYEQFNEISFVSTKDWIIKPQISGINNCNGTSILGGFNGKGKWIMKSFDLPPHHTIYLKFQLWRFNAWDNEKFLVYFDQFLSYSKGYNGIGDKLCINNGSVEISEIEIEYPHQFSTLIILMTTELDKLNFNNPESWGIRNIQMKIDFCKPGCLFCNSNDQQFECISWKLTHKSLTSMIFENFVSDGWFIEKNSILYQQISQCSIIPMFGGGNVTGAGNILFTKYDLPPHNLLRIKFRFSFIDSWGNDNRYEKFYLSINGKISFFDKFSASINGISNICGRIYKEGFQIYDLIFTDSSSSILIEFSTGLTEQLDKESFGIRDMYIYTNQQEICGDGYVLGLEECDDGNIYPFDGCFNCLYSCIEGCQFCISGICLECQDGLEYQELLQLCIEISSNQKPILQNYCYRCECQYTCNYCVKGTCSECQNNNEFDQMNEVYKYHVCNFDCSPFCSECIFGFCFNCEHGYQLIDQKCQPICGDGLIVQFEDCDDQNLIPNDGCYDCQYSCPLDCNNCYKGQCQDICDIGFYFIDTVCQSICQNCISCILGKCLECKQGYEFNQQNECELIISICGNGLLEINEQCDDENLDNTDGCSQKCEIETNYSCKDFIFSYSECAYYLQPIFFANLIDEYNNPYQVMLTFSQKVKTNQLQKKFNNYIQVTLLNLDNQFYKTQIITIQEATEQISNVEYMIEIEIYTNFQDTLILQIHLDETLYNQYDEQLLNNKAQIPLKIPQYLNSDEKQISQTLMQSNRYLIYTSIVIASLSLIMGNSILFNIILNIIQIQSYLKFINVNYPLNLLIFFEQCGLMNIQPLIDILYIEDIIILIFNESFVQCQYKFLYYQINADLFQNFQSQFSQFIIMIFIYYFSKFLIYLIKQLKKKLTETKGKKYICIMFFLKKQCTKFIYAFQNEGLNLFLEANSFDIFFSILLQIKYTNDTIRSVLSQLISFLILFGYLMQTSLNDKKQQQICFQYLNKFSFLSILVLFQETQQIQTLLLSLISSLQFFQIFKFKKLQDKKEFYYQFINELSVFIFTFTTLVYWDVIDYFSNQQKIVIGWIHISILLLALLITIISEVVYALMKIKLKLRSHFNKEIKQKTNPWPLQIETRKF